MTKDDRETLRQLEREATYGPWKVYEVPNPYRMKDGTEGVLIERNIGTEWHHPQLDGPAPVVVMSTTVGERTHQVSIDANNAALIVALRTHATDLLDAHERLEQVRELQEDMETAQARSHQDCLDWEFSKPTCTQRCRTITAVLAILKGEERG
jgi:hypothetical protein